MANILTAAEAATVLRCETTDADMLALLPLVDAYVKNATGRDWAIDNPIYPEAKAAARILITLWHENPGMLSSGMSSLSWGLSACLAQLEAKALILERAGVPDKALAVVSTNITDRMAITASLVVIFNHEMVAAATGSVRLETIAGATVACTNILDVTKKILTVNPEASLSEAAHYRLVLDHPADIYGQTVDLEYDFYTEDPA